MLIVPEPVVGDRVHTTGENPALNVAVCDALSRAEVGVMVAPLLSIATIRSPRRIYSLLGMV